MRDSATALHEDFLSRVQKNDLPERRHHLSLADADLTGPQLIHIFESQLISRLLDLHARRLRARGESFYTIGSSGHEGNAAVAAALKVTDPAFLHYRSGAFFTQRARSLAGETPVWDMVSSFCASSDDPISGGRHKVLGSLSLNIPPQTSTIASHLPKAVGAALSIPLAKRLREEDPSVEIQQRTHPDSIVFCNFGDASANHATAQSAFNLSSWCAYQGLDLPLIWMCEDNGIGISVQTPTGWIENSFKHRPGLHYLACDGLDILDSYRVARQAQSIARQQKPVFIHMKTVRLMGHAGADAEIAYLTPAQIQANHDADPILQSARIMTDLGLMTTEQIADLYQSIDTQIGSIAEQVIQKPRLSCAQDVMRSLVPKVNHEMPLLSGLTTEKRLAVFKAEKRALSTAQPLGKMINFTLAELMAEQKNIVVFGEDVAKKGGVYYVTSRLQEKFGSNRVHNSLLDETSILGSAIGLAQNGFLPIPEIQFLAYVHNAEDQIRGEAATLSFFSDQQYQNPMVIRIAGLAYQKGFGGHFHNDNSFAVFRDIPGVVIACPSNGQDAVALLRSCVELARREGRVVIFIEPIALYMTRDLHESGDELWTGLYPAQHEAMKVGELGIYGEGRDLSIITYGNGYYLSRQAEKILQENYGLNIKVIDLRWLAPLNEAAILEAIKHSQHVLIVDECRRTGSISEALMTLIAESDIPLHCLPSRFARMTAEDSFIPLGAAANYVLPSKDSIIERALELTGVKAWKNAQ